MATLREIIYDVKEVFNSYSDDAFLSEEHIAFLVNSKRAFYLKRILSELKKEIPREFKQKICLSLEEDPDCNDDFILLNSSVKIPATIESTGRSNISEAFLDSKTAKWINIIDYIRLPYLKAGRFNRRQIYVMKDPDDYLLVTSVAGEHSLIENINLNIVAEDPEFADSVSLCLEGEDKCDFWDKQYPISLDVLELIRKDIINELTLKLRIPVDTINNSEDDTLNKVNLNNGRDRNRTGI